MTLDERDADPRASHSHVSIRREGRWRSLLISVGINYPPTRRTFWRSIVVMALLDVVILVLTIGTLYQDAQAGGISIVDLLVMVFSLILVGMGQYLWWRYAYDEVFRHPAEDDGHPEAE